MRLLQPGQTVEIQAGTAGSSEIDAFDGKVPARLRGRTAAHREQFCLVAMLRELLRQMPQAFPATIKRQEAPDFILTLGMARAEIGLEHTDAGTAEHQKALTESERSDEEVTMMEGYCLGDERSWRRDIEVAIARKLALDAWRDAPNAAERWLLPDDPPEPAPHN